MEIAGPGFLNLKLTNKFLISNINKILENKESYGKKNSNNSYNIEFVSANPTGPMHVGHCRGAIYGDVLANLLKFNGNKVTKEYYINDYGNQIKNFVKSVFLRIREIKYNEKFISKADLYPGEYIIEIGKKIIDSNKNEKFDNLDESLKLLKKESLKHSMDLIKSDLKQLGIEHDNFFSETELIENNNEIAETLENYLFREGLTDEIKLAIESFEIWLRKHRVLTKNIIPHNIVLKKIDGAITLKIIDGLGCSSFIPLPKYSKYFAKRYVERRISLMWSRINWDLSGRKGDWK